MREREGSEIENLKMTFYIHGQVGLEGRKVISSTLLSLWNSKPNYNLSND